MFIYIYVCIYIYMHMYMFEYFWDYCKKFSSCGLSCYVKPSQGSMAEGRCSWPNFNEFVAIEYAMKVQCLRKTLHHFTLPPRPPRKSLFTKVNSN